VSQSKTIALHAGGVVDGVGVYVGVTVGVTVFVGVTVGVTVFVGVLDGVTANKFIPLTLTILAATIPLTLVILPVSTPFNFAMYWFKHKYNDNKENKN
jgi:Na+(H+)/acetate symporter ActP